MKILLAGLLALVLVNEVNAQRIVVRGRGNSVAIGGGAGVASDVGHRGAVAQVGGAAFVGHAHFANHAFVGRSPSYGFGYRAAFFPGYAAIGDYIPAAYYAPPVALAVVRQACPVATEEVQETITRTITKTDFVPQTTVRQEIVPGASYRRMVP